MARYSRHSQVGSTLENTEESYGDRFQRMELTEDANPKDDMLENNQVSKLCLGRHATASQ